jgi:acyl carrier protein
MTARQSSDTAQDNVIAKNELHQQVGAIWSDVLQCGEVSAEQNFFELGGDSLMTMMVAFRISDELRVELPPSALAEHPTLGEFCTLIGQIQSRSAPSIGSGDAMVGEGVLEEGVL